MYLKGLAKKAAFENYKNNNIFNLTVKQFQLNNLLRNWLALDGVDLDDRKYCMSYYSDKYECLKIK